MAAAPAVDERVLKLVGELLDGSSQRSTLYPLAVAKVLDYMASHWWDELHLSTLVVHAGVSRAHLYRLFREEVGISPMQLLTLLRVEASKRVLTRRQSTVNDAWRASGFGDLRTYEREFKRWVGCTSTEYRNQTLAQLKKS